MVYIYIIRYNIIYIIYVLFSGFLWSYSVFGGLFFFDIKILSYFLLLLALLIFLYFVKNSKIIASLVLVTGFYFYLQSKISPFWVNTIHQKTLPDFDLNYLTFQIFVFNKIILIILLGILVLQTFFFWKKIKINEIELEKNA